MNRPLDQMKAERDKLEEDIASMRGQIEAAQAEKHRTGQHADPGWWARVNSARRHASARLQKLNRDIAELERARRQGEGSAFAVRFVEAAKRRLRPETFNAIAEEAKETTTAQEAVGR